MLGRSCPMALVWAVLPLACGEPTRAPEPFTIRLVANDVWSGGELQLVAAAFVPPASLPAVLLDGDSLPVRRIDDTTIAARLPVAAGTFSLRVVRSRDMALLGDVVLHGFRDEVVGPFLSGRVYVLQPGLPLIIGAGNSGAAVVDLRFNTIAQTIPDSVHSPDCVWSVGPSYQPGWFVFEGRDAAGVCGPPSLWSIAPSLQLVDALPGWSWPVSWYVMAVPGPRRWFLDWNNHGYFLVCDTGCVTEFFGDPSGPDMVIISPRGDRLLWTPQCCTVAVFDAATMDTAFAVPMSSDPLYESQSYGAAFSAAGDTLFVSVVGPGPHLVAVRASDGLMLTDVRLDSLSLGLPVSFIELGPIALDPQHPWLYMSVVLRLDSLIVPGVIVFDRTTLSPLGVLPAFGASGRYHMPTVVPSPLEHLVYLVATDISGGGIHGSRARILRFETVP